MMKTFKTFVEEKDQDQHMRNMLLQRLGFEPKAMNDVGVGIKIRDLNKDRLKQAIGSMGLDQDTVQQLQNWVENNPDTTLQNLMSQISGGVGTDDFGQSDIPEAPAELPLGQPKPERRPAPSMYGGPPAVDGKLT